MLYYIFLFVPLICVLCQDYRQFVTKRNIIVGNLKKRETRPLNSNNRRVFDSQELRYRRTKDIRDDVNERRQEKEMRAEQSFARLLNIISKNTGTFKDKYLSDQTGTDLRRTEKTINTLFPKTTSTNTFSWQNLIRFPELNIPNIYLND